MFHRVFRFGDPLLDLPCASALSHKGRGDKYSLWLQCLPGKSQEIFHHLHPLKRKKTRVWNLSWLRFTHQGDDILQGSRRVTGISYV